MGCRKGFSDKVKTVETEVLARRVEGQSKSKIAREMRLDRETVMRIEKALNLPQSECLRFCSESRADCYFRARALIPAQRFSADLLRCALRLHMAQVRWNATGDSLSPPVTGVRAPQQVYGIDSPGRCPKTSDSGQRDLLQIAIGGSSTYG
jgi:hypothetical protein